MAAHAYSSMPNQRQCKLPSYIEHEAGVTTVWLRGEHDLATQTALSQMIDRALRADGAGIVIDLSDVEFMSAGTVRVIARSQAFLREASRSLTLRAPSSCARRLLDLCGLDYVGGSVDTRRLAESRL